MTTFFQKESVIVKQAEGIVDAFFKSVGDTEMRVLYSAVIKTMHGKKIQIQSFHLAVRLEPEKVQF